LSKTSVLLVEDEENVSTFVALELKFEGYEVDVAEDGEKAFHFSQNKQYDIILLDWMIPKLDGLEVCRRIRKSSNVPIILLTARDYIGDKIAGLDAGADDYITKPFEIEELLARIRAVLRRTQNERNRENADILSIDTLSIDLKKRSVQRDGKNIELTQKEFDLLYLLMRNEGEVLSRERILSDVWGYDFMGQTNVVDVYIRYLRNKIEFDQQAKLIHTVRGIGYVIRFADAKENE
jgi:DNA-binding response OmpR family regulator